MNKNVTITIKPDGDVTIEANNFAGVGCKAATAEIEMVLAGGSDNVDKKFKPDFFAQNPTSNTVTGR